MKSASANVAATPIAFLVFFDERSAEIGPKHAANLDSAFRDGFGEWAKYEGRDGWVRVVGHVDLLEDGPGTSNLGLKRARSVVDALVARGLDPRRLVAINEGTRPITSNDSSSSNNRFVEVTLCKGHRPACERIYYNG